MQLDVIKFSKEVSLTIGKYDKLESAARADNNAHLVAYYGGILVALSEIQIALSKSLA